MRKKRCDRLHLIYSITIGQEVYIGLTAKTQRTVQLSLRSRINKHLYRCRSQSLNWKLYSTMRSVDTADMQVQLLHVIRGKAPAHLLERELIRNLQPSLNTDQRHKAQ